MDEELYDSPEMKVPVSGGSSLLVIFTVLCLAVFAALSLSTLQADRRLFDALYEGEQAYYRAECEAQKTLGRIRAGEDVPGVETDGDVYSWKQPVGDGQSIACSVRFDGEDWTVLQWAVVRDAEWQGNFDTPVLQE